MIYRRRICKRDRGPSAAVLKFTNFLYVPFTHHRRAWIARHFTKDPSPSHYQHS